MSEERWLPVIGYEGRYSVSDHGRVRSEPGGHRLARVLKDTAAPQRPTVFLFRDGVRHSRRVYHLVMEAFVGPRPGGLAVLHWDDDKSNNHVENLRYGTISENSYDAVRNGRHPGRRKTHCKHGHEFTPENTYMNRNRRQCRTCTLAGQKRNRKTK